ncbi:MAG: hypothetical protein U5L01_15020 [Rheinheimera sp.]|nr:hypothetical protein [Rheinheimera sp.]
MVGRGGYQSGATSTVIDNIDAEWQWFILPQRLNYHLKSTISPVTTNYVRPEWSPEPGYYIDVTQYKLDPAASEVCWSIAGATGRAMREYGLLTVIYPLTPSGH